MFTRVLILLIKEWKAVCLPLSVTLMLVDSNVKQNRIDSNQQSIFQFLWKWAEGLRGQRHFNNKTAPSWRWTHKVRKLHTHCVYRCVCVCVCIPTMFHWVSAAGRLVVPFWPRWWWTLLSLGQPRPLPCLPASQSHHLTHKHTLNV